MRNDETGKVASQAGAERGRAEEGVQVADVISVAAVLNNTIDGAVVEGEAVPQQDTEVAGDIDGVAQRRTRQVGDEAVQGAPEGGAGAGSVGVVGEAGVGHVAQQLLEPVEADAEGQSLGLGPVDEAGEAARRRVDDDVGGHDVAMGHDARQHVDGGSLRSHPARRRSEPRRQLDDQPRQPRAQRRADEAGLQPHTVVRMPRSRQEGSEVGAERLTHGGRARIRGSGGS